MTGRFRDSLLSIDNFPETFFPQKRRTERGQDGQVYLTGSLLFSYSHRTGVRRQA